MRHNLHNLYGQDNDSYVVTHFCGFDREARVEIFVSRHAFAQLVEARFWPLLSCWRHASTLWSCQHHRDEEARSRRLLVGESHIRHTMEGTLTG